jgi:hypothetical protein
MPAGVAISIFAQAASNQSTPLPSQAKPVQGVLVPVPKKVFEFLDEFRDANWLAVQRPEVVHWKSHGDQVQIALLLGFTVAEGFVAMEAEDSIEVKNVGNTVLMLARALGVEERALRRSRSIMERADRKKWAAARKEWDGMLSDLEKGMIELRSEDLSQLVSLGGWLRGTEALCTLILQNYSPERAELIRQPALLAYLEMQLLEMKGDIGRRPVIAKMIKGIRRIRLLIQNETGPMREKTLREIRSACDDLVSISSKRLA